MRRLFEDVVSRGVLMENYKSYDFEAAMIGLWSPGDYEKLLKEDPEYIKHYQKVQQFFKQSFRQEFWDTENNVPGYDSINPNQADALVEYIVDNYKKTFIIHCDAGQSRSAGVALAIECIVKHGGNRYQAGLDNSWTDQERYSPNRYVFDTLMDAWDRKDRV